MAYPFAIPENCKIIQAAVPQVGTAAAVNGVAVSLKNVHKLYAIVDLNTAGGAALALIPQTDAAVAFGTPAVLTTVVHIWANQNVAANDTLVRQANAVNFTTAATANLKQVIFEIDPARLTAGEDCFRMTTGALPITDYVSMTYVIIPRYPGGAPFQPTVLTD